MVCDEFSISLPVLPTLNSCASHLIDRAICSIRIDDGVGQKIALDARRENQSGGIRYDWAASISN